MKILTKENISSGLINITKNHVYDISNDEFEILKKITNKIIVLPEIKIKAKDFFEKAQEIIDIAISCHNKFFKEESKLKYGSGYICKMSYTEFIIETYADDFRIDCLKYDIKNELLQFNENHWCLSEKIANEIIDTISKII